MSKTPEKSAKRPRKPQDAPQCPTCKGTGLTNVAPDVTCTTCGGTGRIPKA